MLIVRLTGRLGRKTLVIAPRNMPLFVIASLPFARATTHEKSRKSFIKETVRLLPPKTGGI